MVSGSGFPRLLVCFVTDPDVVGGIHRSMAVAAITRMLAYPNAVFFIYVRRTREMAAWRRLPLATHPSQEDLDLLAAMCPDMSTMAE